MRRVLEVELTDNPNVTGYYDQDGNRWFDCVTGEMYRRWGLGVYQQSLEFENLETGEKILCEPRGSEWVESLARETREGA